jgi:hypothetical protein
VPALAGRVVGDHRESAAGDQEGSQGVAVVGGIGGADPGRGQRFDQARSDRGIASVARGQREGERPAATVDDRVDLGRAAAT